MPEQLQARVERCYQQAEAFYQRTFCRPHISFKLRGQKAGVAHLDENLLRFNLQLYMDNRDDFLAQTIAHEVAHMIVRELYGRHVQPHGQQWRSVMRQVFNLKPLRCHSYAIAPRASRQFVYRCTCPDNKFTFTVQRHRLVLKGRRYLCQRCRSLLVFEKEQTQPTTVERSKPHS